MSTILANDKSFKIHLGNEWFPAPPNLVFAGKEGRERFMPGTSYHLFTGCHPVGGTKLYLQLVLDDIGGGLKPGVTLPEIRAKLVAELIRKGDLVTVSSPSILKKHCVIYRYNQALFVKKSEASIMVSSFSMTVNLVISCFRIDESRLVKEADTIFNKIEVS